MVIGIKNIYVETDFRTKYKHIGQIFLNTFYLTDLGNVMRILIEATVQLSTRLGQADLYKFGFFESTGVH